MDTLLGYVGNEVLSFLSSMYGCVLVFFEFNLVYYKRLRNGFGLATVSQFCHSESIFSTKMAFIHAKNCIR